MQHQLTQDEFAAVADQVIDNSGSLDDLRSAARTLYTDLVGTAPID
jgi:dephospho-CoA kinase